MKTLPALSYPVQAHSRMEPIFARSRREARKAPITRWIHVNGNEKGETDVCVSLTAVSKCIYFFRNANSRRPWPLSDQTVLLQKVQLHFSFTSCCGLLFVFHPVCAHDFLSAFLLHFICYTITGKSGSLLQFNFLHF